MLPQTIESFVLELILGFFVGYILAFIGSIMIKLIAVFAAGVIVIGNYLGVSPSMSVSDIVSQIQTSLSQLPSGQSFIYANIPFSIGFGAGILAALSM